MQWYQDAVFYEVHVKAFADSNGDGIGDFPGLTQRLDYLVDLGVDCLWLLPMYPSPQRDDGYDISDYRSIHPWYGTMEDFRTFLAAAHERGLRVLTELVLNHTSIEHPWFQQARSSPDNPYRNYYVWSDTPDRLRDTRVIFSDVESSNWTWDERAGAYYWHRFFRHQPDLNYDEPRVLEEIWEVMRFWLDMGVDGFRVDAVPYLVERDGVGAENLPETHQIVKTLRRRIDETYPGAGKILVAEANMWPEDVRPYFGDGDGFHMCFHFPLMPRMFMSLRLEDRKPLVDIILRTPPIPDNCQWGLFLRNHDELTLEMVTDVERGFMWDEYARDPIARLNLGIRRRLAPLMDNDKRRIELMNALLFSLRGSPFIYYGDEIGMGDNIALGDRHGVRTPMHWSAAPNAGFSDPKTPHLFRPLVTDPNNGYQVVNVEAQRNDPGSLLNFMKELIRVRKRSNVFGCGRTILLHPRNHRVFAFVRELEASRVLVIANLAPTAQVAELDLSGFEGAVPIEMFGGSIFPRIGSQPYLFTLSPYAFFWLELRWY